MREIRTSGSMSGDVETGRKALSRHNAGTAPVLDSTDRALSRRRVADLAPTIRQNSDWRPLAIPGRYQAFAPNQKKWRSRAISHFRWNTGFIATGCAPATPELDWQEASRRRESARRCAAPRSAQESRNGR